MMVDGRIQSHVVRYNEILTSVVIPPPKPGVRASFEKLRPRGVWDFAMASLAISLQLHGKTIDDARVVFGGISGKPLRETAVEAFLKGKTLSDGAGRASGGRRPRERRAAQVQRHEDRHGQGTSRLRVRQAERVGHAEYRGSAARTRRVPCGISFRSVP